MSQQSGSQPGPGSGTLINEPDTISKAVVVAHPAVVAMACPAALTFRAHKGGAVNTVAVECAQEADQIFNEVVDIPCVIVELSHCAKPSELAWRLGRRCGGKPLRWPLCLVKDFDLMSRGRTRLV